jgi:hypothetical protein
MEEIWKDIKGYEGIYQISDYGKIINVNTGKLKKCRQNVKSGYCIVELSNKGKTKTFYIHRLVAEAFLDNPDNLPCVNHKDFNRTNNYVDNLEYCTQKYNVNYTWVNGRMPSPPSQEPYMVKRNDGIVFNSLKEAGLKMGINPSIICNHLKGRQKTVKGYTFEYYKEVL